MKEEERFSHQILKPQLASCAHDPGPFSRTGGD
jgi:hypothetical protein